MGVLFGGKLLDFRLQGFMAWQLGNAMRPKITGGCVRSDKIAFVPFPVGAAGFFRFLRFQTVTGRLGPVSYTHLGCYYIVVPIPFDRYALIPLSRPR